MIVIDTNVLLRYLLKDNDQQYQQACRLFKNSEAVLITDVVLVEMLWTLKGKKYRLQHGELASVIEGLFEDACFLFEDNQLIWQALAIFRKQSGENGRQADFADILIALKGKVLAQRANKMFDGFYTFDQGAQKLPESKSPDSF